MKIKLRDIVGIDFETYYSADYSLKKREYNTSSYIWSPQYKTQCVSIRDGTKPAVWYEGKEAARVFKRYDVANRPVVAHNTAFDGFILSQHYGIVPPYYLDTLSMARALHGTLTRADLNTVAQLYQLGSKKPNVLRRCKGVRDIPADLLSMLGEYCAIDGDLCWEIMKIHLTAMPEQELDLIDWTIRAFCDPVLRVDQELVKQEYDDEVNGKAAKQALAGVPPEVLQSADLFAEALQACGIDPPTKISPATGEIAWAFAKTDYKFTDLLNYEDNPMVAHLVAARLATKSTIGETRAKRFMDVGNRAFPMGYSYCAAHTTRWGGNNATNVQNLESGGRLRRAILAPDKHVVGVMDSGQIEARLNAWLSGQDDLLETFRLYDRGEGSDPYRVFAASSFGKNIDDITKDERFVGKTCLAGDTRVFTTRGIIPLSQVTTKDMLWDGQEWVGHAGLVCNGIKKVLIHSGLTATPDHEILTERGWREWSEVLTDHSLFQSALCLVASPSSVTDTTQPPKENSGGTGLLFAVLADMKVWCTRPIFRRGVPHDATPAVKSRLPRNATGSIKPHSQTTSIAPDYSIAFPPSSRAAQIRRTPTTITMAGAASLFIRNGWQTVQHFLRTFRHWMDGTYQHWTSTALTWMVTTLPATYDSYPVGTTVTTNVQSLPYNNESRILKRKLPVYDLANAGPRNRFMVLTDAGPVIVHNCVLGLGYKMGAKKLRATLALGLKGPAVFIDEQESERLVNLYRTTNDKIAAMWDRCYDILIALITDTPGSYKALRWDTDPFNAPTIWLPNGLGLHYHGLEGAGSYGKRFSHFNFYIRGRLTRIYDGMLLENIIQGLARCVISSQLLEVNKEFKALPLKRGEHARVVGMTHDELIAVFPARLAKVCMEIMGRVMTTPPGWALDLPLAAEGGFDVRYSK